MVNPNSLATRCLKTKCYPKDSFLNAKMVKIKLSLEKLPGFLTKVVVGGLTIEKLYIHGGTIGSQIYMELNS